LRPLIGAVGANAAAEPTRREAIVSFIFDGMLCRVCVREVRNLCLVLEVGQNEHVTYFLRANSQ
jgi:hypothetical protein